MNINTSNLTKSKNRGRKMADLQQKSVEHLLSDDFSTFTPEEQTNVIHYLAQLTPIEKKACAIAKEHLETSYDILRSNGFVSWCEKNSSAKIS